jgi:hypothetical protein
MSQPNPNQSVKEQLHRLIIENRSEDGSIPSADQSAMADELLTLLDQISAERETAARIDELEMMYGANVSAETYDQINRRLAALRQPTGEDGR